MRYHTRLSAAAGAGCLATALVGVAATPALADYGKSARYQIEISANNVGGVPGTLTISGVRAAGHLCLAVVDERARQRG